MILLEASRPNRVIGTKDENYHLKQARWCVSQCTSTSFYNEWLKRIQINKNFYKNKQWEMDEDTEAFLKDISGKERNRIRVSINQIRPLVEQYRGNSTILKINASAKSISKMSINRREAELGKLIDKTRIASEFEGIGPVIREKDKMVKDTPEETEEIFKNLYIDKYVPAMNSLLSFGAMKNDYKKYQGPVALNMALSGVAAFECMNHGGHRVVDFIQSEDLIYDPDARLPDMSDATFIGRFKPMDVAFLAEKYQSKKEDLEALESMISSYSATSFMNHGGSQNYSASKIPVYCVYWIDSMQWEMGYVLDPYRQPYLTKINYTYPGEESARYTDKDLIDPPQESKHYKSLMKSRKKKLFFDEVRYCSFIPSEYIGSLVSNGEKKSDLVLDYGLVEYQDIDQMDISNAKLPIKVQTWGFVDGEIFSPVDDAISPQRFINRVMSVTEGLINNSGGAGMIVDEDSIGNKSKHDFMYDAKEGNMLTVESKGKGIPNVIGYYDNTPKQGVYGLFGIIPQMAANIKATTGVNDAIQGQSMGSEQLVGVTEALIQRGSIMQEPFYNAVTDLFVQLFQDNASVGRRYYIDHEAELIDITGTEGAEIIKLSKDMKNEDFRVFITRENDNEVLQNQANQMLMIFLERGFIDQKDFANLYGRSTPSDVNAALRSVAGLRIEAQKQAAIEQQQQAQAMMQEEQARNARMEERQDRMHEDNVDLGLDKNDAMRDAAVISAMSKEAKNSNI